MATVDIMGVKCQITISGESRQKGIKKNLGVFGACVWIRVPSYDCMIYMWKAQLSVTS